MTTCSQDWTALIPLRAGSKGLPGKNIRLLAGLPLFQHAVDVALSAGAPRVVISTDIEPLLEAQFPPPVETIRRPASLCSDQSPMAPVVVHAIEAARITGPVVLLQATSPLRVAADIEAALRRFTSGAFELVMSVCAADSSVLKWGRISEERFVALGDPEHCFSNRQSLPPVVRPNGAIYVMDAAWVAARGRFATERIGVIQMPVERSIDIDSASDLERAEHLLAARMGPMINSIGQTT